MADQSPKSGSSPDLIQVSLAGCEAALECDLRALAAAASAADRAITPADIAELYELRQDVGRAYGQVNDGKEPRRHDPAPHLIWDEVRIPGTDITLHSPTIAARRRHEQLEAWLNSGALDQVTFDLLWVYVLANAGDKSALAKLATVLDAKTAVADWAERELTCYPQYIADAVLQLTAAYPPALSGDATQKKRPGSAAAATMQRSCASSAVSSAATPITGSTASARPAPAGSSAKSAPTSAAPSLANRASSTPTAPESRPPSSTASPSTASAPESATRSIEPPEASE